MKKRMNGMWETRETQAFMVFFGWACFGKTDEYAHCPKIRFVSLKACSKTRKLDLMSAQCCQLEKCGTKGLDNCTLWAWAHFFFIVFVFGSFSIFLSFALSSSFCFLSSLFSLLFSLTNHNPPLTRTMNFTKDDTLAINTIRVLAADTVFKGNSGHPGMQSLASKPSTSHYCRPK